MSRRQEPQSYSGFDDADDFLPDDLYDQDAPAGNGRDTREWTGKRRIRPLAKLVFALLIIAAVTVILNETLMKIRHIRIYGNRTISSEDIAEQAGLRRDMGFFSVNEESIKAALERNPYLQFKELHRQFPDTLALVVKERAPCSNVQGGSALYLVDEDAYVLHVFSQVKTQNNLPTVIGMHVREALPGRQIVSNRAGKVDEYRAIMEELLLQGVVTDFEEINLTNSQQLYLRHKNGYMAELGTIQDLMAKIGTLRAVITALEAQGIYGGYIDVTVSGEAIYSPQ